MSKQHYEIVVVGHFLVVANESVDEVFRMSFIDGTRSKRIFATHTNKLLTIFHVEAKTIDQAKVKKIEKFLISSGYTKLFSAVYSDKMSELDARFFTIRLHSKNFSDMKALLISKIEKAIGGKLKVYDDEIYYFHLTKSQIKSRRLVRLIDDLLFNPAIEVIICI